MSSLSVQTATIYNGIQYKSILTEAYENVMGTDKTVDPAVSGTLTTRTTTSVGTLTMDSSSHGITTGTYFDLFWADGSRTAVKAGTVSGTSVPITTGGGDDLPAAATAITAMIPIVETLAPIDGDRADAILIACADFAVTNGGAQSYVKILSQNNHVLATYHGNDDNGRAFIWTYGSGATNPVTSAGTGTAISDYPDKISFSHGAITAKRMKGDILFS